MADQNMVLSSDVRQWLQGEHCALAWDGDTRQVAIFRAEPGAPGARKLTQPGRARQRYLGIKPFRSWAGIAWTGELPLTEQTINGQSALVMTVPEDN